jgi:hypothetical protein
MQTQAFLPVKVLQATKIADGDCRIFGADATHKVRFTLCINPKNLESRRTIFLNTANVRGEIRAWTTDRLNLVEEYALRRKIREMHKGAVTITIPCY